MKTFAAGVISFLNSVRFRLTLWFTLILALILVVFSVFVYYRQRQDLRDQTATRVILRLREISADYQRITHDREENNILGLPAISGDNIALQENEVLVLSDGDGNVVGFSDTVNKAQAADIARGAVVLANSRNNARFFQSRLNTPATGRRFPSVYVFAPTQLLLDRRIIGYITLGLPVDPTGQLPRLALTLAFACGFTTFIALAGGYGLASRALWPVKAITRTAQEISETGLDRRLGIHTRDELGELAGTFDRMLDRLQAAFTRQRQFTADASHELRTPLTIISLETDRALANARGTDDFRQALRVIQSENQFMSRLVGELLTLARMDAGQMTLQREPIDLSDVVLDVVERYAPLAAHKHIALRTGDLPEIPVQADRQLLSQMVGNLVDNAIKYSPDGASQWVLVETGLLPGTAQAWLRISDNGPGIPAEHLPHLFERFYRVDSARSHNPGEGAQDDQIPGSGLGLSIVQWIAQVHGGSVQVESQVGQGTRFEVRLPAAV